MSSYSIYLIRLENGHLYTGITNDVQRRFAEHVSGGKKAARYLRGKGTLTLVFSRQIGSRSQALKVEAALKKMTKQQKEQIIVGEIDIQNLVDQ